MEEVKHKITKQKVIKKPDAKYKTQEHKTAMIGEVASLARKGGGLAAGGECETVSSSQPSYVGNSAGTQGVALAVLQNGPSYEMRYGRLSRGKHGHNEKKPEESYQKGAHSLSKKRGGKLEGHERAENDIQELLFWS